MAWLRHRQVYRPLDPAAGAASAQSNKTRIEKPTAIVTAARRLNRVAGNGRLVLRMPRVVSAEWLQSARSRSVSTQAGPEADLASATERAAQAAREGNSPEGRPFATRAAISATGMTWAVDIASMTRVA